MTNPFAQWSRASACALAIVCFAPSGAAFAAQATADVPTAGASIASAASTPAPGTPTSAAAAARSFATSPAAIHGAVVDARTGKPIPAAIVTIGGRPLRADDRGAFSADAAAADIAVRAPGYLATRARAEAGRPVTVALAPFRPKAVYLSVFGITSKTLREAAVDLKGATAINALVVDMKGDRGITPYPSAARRASGAAARTPNAPVVRDFAALVADLHRRGLYLIARIVVFKDDPLAAAHPEWTVRDADGNIWRDREKLRWIDPSLRETWAHNLDVAEEAAKLGFDEIQFDYVRFPDARELRFSVPNTRANRTAAIAGFLRAARERLAPYNVFVAADIFGYVCWNEDDTDRPADRDARRAARLHLADALPVRLHVGLAGLHAADRRSRADRTPLARRGALAHRPARRAVPAVAAGVSRLCVRSPRFRGGGDPRAGGRRRGRRHRRMDAVERAQSLRSAAVAEVAARMGPGDVMRGAGRARPRAGARPRCTRRSGSRRVDAGRGGPRRAAAAAKAAGQRKRNARRERTVAAGLR